MGVISKWFRSRCFCVIYAVMLIGFSTFAVLDTFVIRHAVSAVYAESGSEAPESGVSSASSENGISSAASESGATSEVEASDAGVSGSSGSLKSGGTVIGTYDDEDMSVTVTEYYENGTAIYVADVVVSSPDVLKTAFAEDTYGRNIKETTSSMAASNSAVLAINGDFYGAQSRGYVIRDGVLYRSEGKGDQEDLVIMEDGSFMIINESEVTAAELLEEGARQVLSFGPALIENGAVSVTSSDEVGKAMASNPRTAIGIIDDCHYVFVVSDGRTDESEGLSLYELAEFMESLGVETAYNLDGGGSSTMWFRGSIVNNPTTGGSRVSERSVSDIVYV